MNGAVEQTVLLVEDELLNRDLVRAILARTTDPRLRALRLIEAVTVAEARLMLASEHIDLVLLDLQLQDGSGLEVAAEIAALGSGVCRPVVIAVTAGAFTSDREAAMTAGCTAVLTKPFAIDEFEALMIQHLVR